MIRPPTREVSKSDPESGKLHKEGKPDSFRGSEHRTVDSKHSIVVNVRISPANVNDAEPIAEILKDIEKRLGKQPKYMGLDAGYHSAPVCHQLASSRDTAGNRLPEAYAQGRLFREIPFHL